MLIVIGLLCISLGWFYQAYAMLLYKKAVNVPFVGLYAFGTILLAADAILNGLTLNAFMHLLSLVAALFVGFILFTLHDRDAKH